MRDQFDALEEEGYALEERRDERMISVMYSKANGESLKIRSTSSI